MLEKQYSKVVSERNSLYTKLNLLEEIFLFKYRRVELDISRAIIISSNQQSDNLVQLYEFPSYESESIFLPSNVCFSVSSKAEIIDLATGSEYWYCIYCNSDLLGNGFLWVPEYSIVEYTFENMYSIVGPLQLQDDAVLYVDPACTRTANEWYYNFYIIENMDNGISKIAINHDSNTYRYVYYDKIYFPEP